MQPPLRVTPAAPPFSYSPRSIVKAHNLSRHIFLSTDDPKVVADAKAALYGKDWTLSYLRLERSATGQPLHTPDHLQKLGANATLNALLDFKLALECDGWVGTLRSNWDRLIDEIRSTVGFQAHRSFENLNPKYDFYWR